MEECVVNPREKPKPKPKPRARGEGVEEKRERPVSGGNIVEALISQNQQLDEGLEKCNCELTDKQKNLEELEKQLEELKATEKGMDDELESLSAAGGGQEEEIEKYLVIYERLKADEKRFKASCNEELERLQKELESLNTDFSEGTKADIVAQLERNQAKIEAGRIELATINRKVAGIQRQIEQVPNRMELREYRLRFSELYNQVSATHRSTKQFYSLYNSLEDTKRYLEKELSLLNSIVDSYQLACTTAAGREEFLRQLQGINEGMQTTCSKVDLRYQTDKTAVEMLQAEIQRLLDVRVAYEKCILELETECRKNDQLLAECKAIEGEVKVPIQSQGSSSGDSDND